ncbi:MAG TPA: methylated-DNA--[protein]-cysteine S-methyltransferase [Streptosporangiaceae bacterium]|nr:methylated-DNA--[protein]-cysteine S-methyltransferase [Streptosporangiaceae bacterium]
MIATTMAPRRAHAVMDSPVGPLTLVMADGVLTGLYMDVAERMPRPEICGDGAAETDARFAAPASQLRDYFAGRRTEFDLQVGLEGTPFQRRVWAALQEIPFGETISYGELAHRIGQRTAARAVGLANGRNPISIIVPCHRVIGADGSLTGYGGGLARKQHLLAFERDVMAAGPLHSVS